MLPLIVDAVTFAPAVNHAPVWQAGQDRRSAILLSSVIGSRPFRIPPKNKFGLRFELGPDRDLELRGVLRAGIVLSRRRALAAAGRLTLHVHIGGPTFLRDAFKAAEIKETTQCTEAEALNRAIEENPSMYAAYLQEFRRRTGTGPPTDNMQDE